MSGRQRSVIRTRHQFDAMVFTTLEEAVEEAERWLQEQSALDR
jgi:hypothetical protein